MSTNIKNALIFFVSVNILLYAFIFLFNNHVPFNKPNYIVNFHHYIPDNRIENKNFNLINSLAQADAQWYLKVAEKGYPKNPYYEKGEKDIGSGLSYAFFPLYPLVLKTVNLVFQNIETSAFILANIMLIVNFLSLIFVIKSIESEKAAIKTAFLLFFFPFSIFYRSYFTESVFLFLLIWFSYFFINKNYLKSGLLLGLLNITRGTGVLIFLPFLYFLIKDVISKKTPLKNAVLSLMFSVVPVILWSLYSYVNTGDFLYFMHVRSYWTRALGPFAQFAQNTESVSNFLNQNLHFFHSSQIDIMVILGTLILLFLSYRTLKIKMWLISFCIFLAPLIFNDIMSYSRMQIVSFPLFLFLALKIKDNYYFPVLAVFISGLFIISLFFVNWYWIG